MNFEEIGNQSTQYSKPKNIVYIFPKTKNSLEDLDREVYNLIINKRWKSSSMESCPSFISQNNSTSNLPISSYIQPTAKFINKADISTTVSISSSPNSNLSNKPKSPIPKINDPETPSFSTISKSSKKIHVYP